MRVLDIPENFLKQDVEKFYFTAELFNFNKENCYYFVKIKEKIGRLDNENHEFNAILINNNFKLRYTFSEKI
jgi:hypothetical protein